MAVYLACPLLLPDSIRIVLLHPSAQPRSEVHCELISTSLSSIPKDETLNYTTLSYAWGDTQTAQSIIVSGERLDVGANLFSALQALRRQDHPIRLWVDALSINQTDPDERSQQVQQMRTIYASAFETVIYLGPDDGSTACRSAWNLLESRSAWAMNQHRDPDDTLPKTREKYVDFKNGYTDVLNSVMSRDWFKRIWVIQEMVVSQQLSIQCGYRRIPWDDFCRSLFLYSGPPSESSTQITEIRTAWQVVASENPGWKDCIIPVKEMCQTRLLYQKTHRDSNTILPEWALNDPLAHFITDDTEFRQGSLRLPHLLSKSRKFYATEPRDKVFALLGISAPLGSTNVQSLVDYNKPVHQTYREMTSFILEAESTFDILSQAGQTSQVEDLKFSSWAGKWSEHYFPPTSVLSRLGGESDKLTKMRGLIVSEHHTWSGDGKILGCTGGIMGELVAVGQLGIHSQSRTSIDDPADWFERWKEFIPSAASLIQDSKWTIAEQDVDVDLIKTIRDKAQGHFQVTVSPNPAQDSDKMPVQENIFVAGGGGFTSDVFALREGRMLVSYAASRRISMPLRRIRMLPTAGELFRSLPKSVTGWHRSHVAEFYFSYTHSLRTVQERTLRKDSEKNCQDTVTKTLKSFIADSEVNADVAASRTCGSRSPIWMTEKSNVLG
jgi:hypothetical protein